VDSTRAPIDVLPEVVQAAGQRLTVLVDSGFRRGADVVKALALGAKAVLIGRATLYGTAVAGEAGAARAIEIYRDEIDRLLALIGCPGIASLGPEFLARPSAVLAEGGAQAGPATAQALARSV
jgi:isopentenyl diphosphate isomerase/L-lactate dehydrogenase-like FMN-dependent dehydrogenase